MLVFVTSVRDVEPLHKHKENTFFFFLNVATKKKATLTHSIRGDVERKEMSEFDISILARCNKYVKCIIY